MILHAVAAAFDDDGLGVMQEAVQDGGGDGAVVVEHRGPLLEGFVGRQNNRTPFVALADDLEEEVGPVLIDRQIPELVQEQKFRGQIALELAFEQAAFLGGSQVVDDADGVGKEDGVAFLAGRVAQGGGQMGFAQADIAQQHDVGFVREELEAKEVLDRQPVDFLGPVPAELFEGFEHREAGSLDAAFDDALAALGVFTFDEAAQVFHMVPVLLRALLGEFAVVLL